LAAASIRLQRLDDSVFALVLEDLGGPSRVGRAGMSAEQVLRALVLRQITQWSFNELAFHLEDSATCQAFCRFGLGSRTPSVGTLKRNVKKVNAVTLEVVNQAIARQALRDEIEDGARVRGDSTVMETNVHSPTDSSLLWDALRGLTSLLVDAKTLCSEIATVNHKRSAKKLIQAIYYAKGIDEKRPHYRKLYKHTERTITAAENAAVILRQRARRSAVGARREKVAAKLESLIGLTHKVMRQTRVRVFEGNALPSAEKIASLSEPHTAIIMKGKRRPEYGHKLFLASGSSGLILDCYVGEGNTADSRQAVPTIERVAATMQSVAAEVSFDGGYASKDNVADLKELGVREVAFHKKCGIEVEDMTSSPTLYEALRRFRACIEATIGWLKRSFGLRRCPASGLESFKAHAQAAILAANLLLLARIDLSPQTC
jgi:IS5 family transposase